MAAVKHYSGPRSPKKVSKEQISSSTAPFEILEYSGQRDFDPNQVECFLTNPNEAEKSVQLERRNKLSCQICQECFEGSTSRHRLLEHINSIHSFNIYDKGDTCHVCEAVFYTSRAFKMHKINCERELESPQNKGAMDQLQEERIKSNSENEIVPKQEKAAKADLKTLGEAIELDSVDGVVSTERELLAVKKDALHNSLKCYICFKIFRRPRDFRSHITSSHRNELSENDFDDLSYRCKKCASTFPNIISLRGHFFKKHVALIVYRCSVCHVTLKTKKSLRSHYNNLHARKRKELRTCGECGKELGNLRALKAHIRLKHDQNINKQGFRCRLCEEKFETKESRKLHYEEKHLGESPFMCADCGKGFSSKSGLYGHRQLHKSDQPSTCPYCEKIFNRKDSYHEHILIHVGPRHRCPHCPKEFVQRSNLVRHIRIHTGQKPYTCTFCDKRFSDKGACNSHIRVHTKEEQCTCPYCGQSFTKKQKLKYHIRKHTGEGLLSCEICSKTFTNAFALKEHRAIHDRQTQTICVECGKAFNSPKYLQRHIALVHQDPQDSSITIHCPICRKTFYHQTRLKSHLVTHLGKKHLQCLICEKRYSSVKSVRNHLKQSHDLTPDQPEFKKSFRSAFGSTQIPVNAMQLVEDSKSLEISNKAAALTFLLKQESSAVVLSDKEKAVEREATFDHLRDNKGAVIKWMSKFHDERLTVSSLGDEGGALTEKDSGKTARNTELMKEIDCKDLTKPKEPQQATEELRGTSMNISLPLNSNIFDDENNVGPNHENTNNDEPLCIKVEEILSYDKNYEANCGTALNLAVSSEMGKINDEILNTLYERTTHTAIVDFGEKSSNVEKKPIILDKTSASTHRLSPRKLESNLSAIIEDRMTVNDEPNECESRNNPIRELVLYSEDLRDFKIPEKESRSSIESSKEISRRRKQLRTPKKYVSPIDMLRTYENKLKNVIPKRERVEAIARSLKKSSNLKNIFIEETK